MDNVVINCYEIFLIVFLQNWFCFFFLLSSGVFKKNNIDGCERAAGPSYEMEINHLHQSEKAIVSFGLRQYKQRQVNLVM